MSTSIVVVITLKPPCIITNSYPTSASQILHSHTRIFSLSTTQGTAPVTTTTTTATKKSVAIYLKKKLGFSKEQSRAISRKLIYYMEDPRARQVTMTDLISIKKADNVITYLQDENECGLDLSHIKKIVTKYPLILTFDLDKTVKPKITLLQDVGFSTSDLAHVLSDNPRLYLETDLGPAVQSLRGILGSDDKAVVKALKGFRRVTGPTMINNMISNVNMLENEYGVPREKISHVLTRLQRVIMARNDRLREVLVRVEHKWGISRDSTAFLKAVHVLSGLSDENIDAKCQVFNSFGWSESDIISLVRKNPYCLAYSEARMNKFLEFFMNELGCIPAYLISRPSVFNYSLENTVLPRHRILSILKEKGLVKAEYKLYNAIACSDVRFFDRFILPYRNLVPELHQLYVNGCRPDLPADNN